MQSSKKRVRSQVRQSLEEPDSDWSSLSHASREPEPSARKRRQTPTKQSTSGQQQAPTRLIKNKISKTFDHTLDKKGMHRIILWLRNDLRLHDNPVMHWAAKQKQIAYKEVLPVYCFDPRFYDRTVKKYNIKKCGHLRTRFNLETVTGLRKNLENIGSGLLVSHEKPETFLSQLISGGDIKTTVVYQQEICSEELRVENQVISEIQAQHKNVDFVSVWGSTLHHIDDLPYKPLEYFPHVYGNFRKKQEDVKVRPLVPTPVKGDLPLPAKDNMTRTEGLALNFEPKLEDFGFTKDQLSETKDKRACLNFVGGEDNGLKRLDSYISSRAVGHYNDTRNNLIGSNYSSKLSPWLQNGALSCRQVYWQTKEFEKKHKANESTRVFIDELFWRDFNRFWCMNHGDKMFSEYGIYDRQYYNWKTDTDIVQRWREGTTGMPLIDALMRDMNKTGFMPNRGRMIVACYFAQDLKQDWRWGAHWFEQQLIDHDVQSNYGGWCGSSGIGPGRVLVFNSLLQSTKFDPQGEYIKMWCPELASVPTDYIHDPWNMPKSLQKSCKVSIGTKVDGMEYYPAPIKCDKYTTEEAAKKIKRSTKPQRATSNPPPKQSSLGSFVTSGKK